MNKLKVKSKKYKVDISNLGISMQEFLNNELIVIPKNTTENT